MKKVGTGIVYFHSDRQAHDAFALFENIIQVDKIVSMQNEKNSITVSMQYTQQTKETKATENKKYIYGM